MEDPLSGVEVGTQNLHFSGNSSTRHENMGSQTGFEKRSGLEGVQTLEVKILIPFSAGF